MKTVIAVVVLLCGLTVGQQPQAALSQYVIVAHKGSDYTVRHGRVLMKVTYAESQTSTAKPGDFPGSGLHYHSRNGVYPHDLDLSQVPEVGLRSNQCVISKTPDHDGDPVIAIQPTPEPCMMQNGNTLHYLPAPNASTFTYVNFDIVSERLEAK